MGDTLIGKPSRAGCTGASSPMLTPHELALVLAYNSLKLSEVFPVHLAKSVTVQAALSGLSDQEFEAVKQKKPQTFAELMQYIGEQQQLRKER